MVANCYFSVAGSISITKSLMSVFLNSDVCGDCLLWVWIPTKKLLTFSWCSVSSSFGLYFSWRFFNFKAYSSSYYSSSAGFGMLTTGFILTMKDMASLTLASSTFYSIVAGNESNTLIESNNFLYCFSSTGLIYSFFSYFLASFLPAFLSSSFGGSSFIFLSILYLPFKTL